MSKTCETCPSFLRDAEAARDFYGFADLQAPMCARYGYVLGVPIAGEPDEFKPLVLDEKNRLYLYRYWEYEKKLADALLERAVLRVAKRSEAELGHVWKLAAQVMEADGTVRAEELDRLYRDSEQYTAER